MAADRLFRRLMDNISTHKASKEDIGEVFDELRSNPGLDSSSLPEVEVCEEYDNELAEHLVEVWNKIESAMDRKESEATWWQLPIVRAAAAVVLLLMMAIGGYAVHQKLSWVNYQTAVGEIRTLELEDGSVVFLNGNSELRVKRNLSPFKPRHVYLYGEANFQVAKALNDEAQFTVHTRDLDVEVLGTRFNVNSRTRGTVVYLEEGSVKVKMGRSEEQTEKLMSPGEKLEFSSRHQQVSVSMVESATNEISWKEGIYEFENLPLERILMQISDPYDIKYRILSDSLRNRAFTIRIPDNDLEFAISVLQKLTGASIVHENGTLIVRE